MKKLGLLFLLSLPHPSFAVVCHPKIDPLLPQYIIGYGSLIDEQSKKQTDPTAQESFPALIKGIVNFGFHFFSIRLNCFQNGNSCFSR